jgi:hypothetical protein
VHCADTAIITPDSQENNQQEQKRTALLSQRANHSSTHKSSPQAKFKIANATQQANPIAFILFA